MYTSPYTKDQSAVLTDWTSTISSNFVPQKISGLSPNPGVKILAASCYWKMHITRAYPNLTPTILLPATLHKYSKISPWIQDFGYAYFSYDEHIGKPLPSLWSFLKKACGVNTPLNTSSFCSNSLIYETPSSPSRSNFGQVTLNPHKSRK